jgi:predicted ATPase/class 3 adenylate cyclase
VREERKVVTALFADIAGSTALSERFDPEDVTEIVGAAVSKMVEAVESFGGTVKDLAGDGVLALFGAPESHEDDAERAVLTGMRIVDDVRVHAAEVERSKRVSGFGVRVGIETGLVVLGPVGGGSRIEYGATGDALNVAARIQGSAEPFTVLVGPATHALTEHLFLWSQARPLSLKGKSEPVEGFTVEGVRTDRRTRRGSEAGSAPVLGRPEELRAIEAFCRGAEPGAGSVLFITGEAGLGKTRLLNEAKRTSWPSGNMWLEGLCASYGKAIPYLPFRGILRGWLEADQLTDDEAALEKLSILSKGVLLDRTEELLPHLAVTAGLRLETSQGTELQTLSPEARQYRTTEAIRQLIAGLSDERAVIVAIEDLHWADPSSLQLLGDLLPLAERSSVRFVFTLRPEANGDLDELRRAAGAGEGAQEIQLRALTDEADRQILRALVGEAALPADLEARILDASEGNPLYLEEFARSLIDRGSLLSTPQGWRFEGDSSIEVPPTLERLVISRIDRLPPEARDLVGTAAVLGTGFTRELIAAVASVDPTPAIEQLKAGALLVEEPSDVFRFRHALIREASYTNLLKRTRREIHAQAAAALETIYGAALESDLPLIAHHYREAGELEPALRYFELAADASRRLYAVAEAVEQLTAAIEIAGSIGSQRRPKLLHDRGMVRGQSGAVSEARQDLEDAISLARETGDRRLEIESTNELGFLLAGAVSYDEALPLLERSLADAENHGFGDLQVAAASRLSIFYTNLLRLDLARDRAKRALQLASELRDERGTAMAMDAMQVASVMIGDVEELDRVSTALAEVNRRRGDLWYLQWTLFQWAWVDMVSARWEAAERRFIGSLGVNRQIGDDGNESAFIATLSWIARVRGRYAEALELGRSAMEKANAAGHPEFLSWSSQQLGWSLLEMLAFEPAVEQLQLSLETAEQAGARLELIRAACLLSLALWLAGDEEKALSQADQAERLVNEVTVPEGRAYLHGADGPLALATIRAAAGDANQALAIARPILDAARRAGWNEVVARGALTCGRAAASAGDRAGSREALELAADTAERFQMPGLAWRAHLALSDLEAVVVGHPHRSRAEEVVVGLARSIQDEEMAVAFRDAALKGNAGGGFG